jgi:hypothetical protein
MCVCVSISKTCPRIPRTRTLPRCGAPAPAARALLTHIYLIILDNQLPHKIVNLLFTFAYQNIIVHYCLTKRIERGVCVRGGPYLTERIN